VKIFDLLLFDFSNSKFMGISVTIITVEFLLTEHAI